MVETLGKTTINLGMNHVGSEQGLISLCIEVKWSPGKKTGLRNGIAAMRTRVNHGASSGCLIGVGADGNRIEGWHTEEVLMKHHSFRDAGSVL